MAVRSRQPSVVRKPVRRYPAPAPMPKWWSNRWLFPAVILVLCAIAYSNSFAVPFVFDDLRDIQQNPDLRTLWPTWRQIVEPFPSAFGSRPVSAFTAALNYKISGIDTWSYHALNFALHVASAWLLLGLIRRTLRLPVFQKRYDNSAPVLAGIIATAWAVHPLQTATVTYLGVRSEVMVGFFYLLTLYAALRAFTSPRPVGWYALSVAACALGMGSKEVMVSAPLTVLLYDWLFVSRDLSQTVRRRWGFHACIFATWLILLGLVLINPHSRSTGFDQDILSSREYLQTQAGVIVHYLRLSFWPTGLILDYGPADYGTPIVRSFAASIPWGVPVVAMLGLTVWGLWWRRAPWAFLGAWFFLILAPSSSFLPILTEVIAEHRMYLPLAAVICAVVFGIHTLLSRGVLSPVARRRARLAALCVSVALLGVLVWRTIDRNHDYRHLVTIWQDNLAKRPGNVQAAGQVAWLYATYPDVMYRNSGEAVRLAERTIREHKPFLGLHDVLAAAYAAHGQFEKAVAAIDREIFIVQQTGDRNNTLDKLLTRRELYRSGRRYIEDPFVDPFATDGK